MNKRTCALTSLACKSCTLTQKKKKEKEKGKENDINLVARQCVRSNCAVEVMDILQVLLLVAALLFCGNCSGDATDDHPNFVNLPELDEVTVDALGQSQVAAEPLHGFFRWDKAAVLTDATRNFASEKFDMMVVAFLAPRCANSQRLSPVLDALAKSREKLPHTVLIAKVDASTNPKLCREYGVDGSPQVFWKVYSNISPYRQGFNVASLTAFIHTKTEPLAQEVVPMFNATVYQTVMRMVSMNRFLVLGFFERPNIKNRGRDLKTFVQATSSHPSISSAYILVDNARNDVEKVAAQCGARMPGVRLFRRIDDGFSTNATNFRGRITKDSLKNFIRDETTPRVVVFSAETASMIFEDGLKKEHVLFIGDAQLPPLASVVERIASQPHDRLGYVSVPTSSSRLLLYFGISESELPLIAIVDSRGTGKKELHPYRGDWELQNIQQFIGDYVDGTLFSNEAYA